MTAIERLSAIPGDGTPPRRRTGLARRRHPAADIARSPADGGAAARTEAARSVFGIGGVNLCPAPPPPAAGSTDALLVLRYPVALALADFRPLQLGMLMAGPPARSGVACQHPPCPRHRLPDQRAEARPAPSRPGSGPRSRWSARTIAGLARSFNATHIRGIFERETDHPPAFNDVLTELPNRVFFRQQLTRGCARRTRMASRSRSSPRSRRLQVGQRHARHLFGDLVLKQAGAILQRVGQLRRPSCDESRHPPLHAGSEVAASPSASAPLWSSRS